MHKRLTTEELGTLEALLDRACYNDQIGIGAMIGDLIDCDGQDVIGDDGISAFIVDEDVGGVCNTGEQIHMTIQYKNLKWLWARVQGARGGAKRKLSSSDARAMAAKRHAKG